MQYHVGKKEHSVPGSPEFWDKLEREAKGKAGMGSRNQMIETFYTTLRNLDISLTMIGKPWTYF